MRTGTWPRAIAMVLAAVLALGACSSGSPGSAEPLPLPPATVVVHDQQPGTAFDRRLLGTNLPAWVGRPLLVDPAFVAATVASGATVIRMPGGSWSDSYEWLACENLTAECLWDGAVRPQDYIGFLEATGAHGMWTINVNDTAQSAAALVAYFNGSVGDQRVIGVDRHGVDWQTVGTWAQLRTDHGHPQPAGVALWEIGNEVWGAKASAEGDCASFGWEDAWTCDGRDYVSGDADHDGFVAMRSAMRAVDPSISVGAVGVIDQSSWGNWGHEVLDGAAGQMDFYVVHHYGFDRRPSASGALHSPAAAWSDAGAEVVQAVQAANPGADVPVAVTEYNLVSGQDLDDDALMTKAVNALYIADSIGQMAVNGMRLANQWNLINGRADNGTDYGMLDAASRAAPQYAALALWSRFGSTMVRVDGADRDLRVYASTSTDGSGVRSIVVLAINLAGTARTMELSADSLPVGSAARVEVTSMRAPTLTSTELVAEAPAIGGSSVPSSVPIALAAANVPPPAIDLGNVSSPFTVDLPPWSISVYSLQPA